MAIDIATGLVMIGAAASIVGAAIATGIAQASIGSAAMGLLARSRRLRDRRSFSSPFLRQY